MNREILVRDSKGRFPADRQRRFDRAFTAIARLARGRDCRLSDWFDAPYVELDPAEVETVRWLLVAMSRARATPGSAAIARLARRGYAISTMPGAMGMPPKVAALDTPGFVHRGHVLPWCRRPWKWIERVALGIDPEDHAERHWCSAHETLRIIASLQAEGHIFD
jgi:hypothetical protein